MAAVDGREVDVGRGCSSRADSQAVRLERITWSTRIALGGDLEVHAAPIAFAPDAA